ncbi:MAG: transporter [Sphingomonadaceae bacterium]|jgi:choline/carnitine/betaine transport|uniref:BCCT family transporter n=5 Tax=Erythrobacteraceae TaxID=335929 RepID=A0A6I4UAZ1_9SPHN|nr:MULTISPECIES: BCCT family transporter [Erythrobacteraceae]MAL54059.1 transporter [Sphingomonadaceae bacterium]MBN91631.1 transporter [Erythrobacteraceae bacterium]MCZ4264726.1 BCCT family transporter [Erythrobacter sp. G21629-S1]RZP20188.1 MAG: BCCT family transporter [Erythrobacter sp.]KNH01559.1 Glycine betaine transporter [Qipengyuania citrea LAMA 915]|tara:strand:- start:202 stop:1884 length:1683 start_codon:yes stop_codon:yes gene_type:complete
MPAEPDHPIDPPLIDLPIKTASRGFYDGFSREVTIPSKVIVSLLIMWAIFFPVSASETLSAANSSIIATFSGWYVYLVAFLMFTCFVLALFPQSGTLRIGNPGEKPEFGRFSWFAMLFGAGIGIGMLTYSTGEPLAHFSNNPDIIRGLVDARTAEAVRPAYIYTFLHWGFAAWGTYALVGLAIGYVAYRRNLPLTIRSALAPLFGLRLSGVWGHLVDIVAVVATILGVAVTMGIGVEQFVMGLARLGVGDWLLDPDGSSSIAAVILSLLVLVGASTISALSGVGRGIKWLSNLNMGLSFALLALFAIVGSAFGGLKLLGVGVWDYLRTLVPNSLTLFDAGGEFGDALVQWQLDWSVFYWAWWIAFAPFVGMFIARISRGRTIREYVFGVVLVPSLMCFFWMAMVGGTAIDLELSGAAQGSIVNAAMSDQLFATLAVLLDPAVAAVVSGLVVLLLMTYLITSADSAILIVNTINGAGESESERNHHILFWGVALAFVVGSMLILGGIDAIRITMIIGALPFSFVVAIMGVAILKAVIYDLFRKHHGVPTTAQGCAEAAEGK